MDESRNTFALKRHDVMLSALQFLGEVHLLIMEYDELCNEHSGAAWRE